MSDFKPIETQEQFNAMIKDRLEQAERSFLEKHGNTDELKKQLADKETEIADITKQLEEANKKIEILSYPADQRLQKAKDYLESGELNKAKNEILQLREIFPNSSEASSSSALSSFCVR